MQVKVLVAQSCPTLCDPMDCGPPDSSVRGILQARILEWVAVPFSRGSSQPRDWTQVSHIADSLLSEPPRKPLRYNQFSSVAVVSSSLWPHGLQHIRLPCPSPTPRACSNSCPLSWWCHPAILSSFVPFSSCLQSFPASGSFLMSQFFASGGQSIGASASASVLPMNIQEFPLVLDWFDLLTVQGTLKSLFQNHNNTTDTTTYQVIVVNTLKILVELFLALDFLSTNVPANYCVKRHLE